MSSYGMKKKLGDCLFIPRNIKILLIILIHVSYMTLISLGILLLGGMEGWIGTVFKRLGRLLLIICFIISLVVVIYNIYLELAQIMPHYF